MQEVSGFSDGLKSLFEKYSILISFTAAILIALLQWFIAYLTNRPSKLEVETLIFQSLRLKYETEEQYFIKMFGKKVTDYSFTYISERDLPVIYAKLYEEERLLNKGNISINKQLVDDLTYYFNATKNTLDDFFLVYNKEAKKQSPNPNIQEGFMRQLMEHLHNKLIFLHQRLGVKFITLNDASIKTYESAYSDTLHLIDYLRGDFEELRDSIVERESTDKINPQEEIHTLFNSANQIAKNLMGTSGEATFNAFTEGVQFRHILKQAMGTKLYNLSSQVIQDVLNSLASLELAPLIVQEEGAYPSYLLYNQAGEKHLTLRYIELDNKVLQLELVGDDEKVCAVVMFIDEEETKYMIDNDMGVSFIAKCINQVKTHLNCY